MQTALCEGMARYKCNKYVSFPHLVLKGVGVAFLHCANTAIRFREVPMKAEECSQNY